MGENDWNTRMFSKKEEKILRFQKHRDTCGDGLDEDYYIFL